jgi:hypothetical protein
LKSAPVTEFDYHYFEGFVFVDVEASDYIIAVAEHHQLRLCFAETSANLLYSLTGVKLDCLEVQNFDGNNIFCLIIHAFVYCSEGTSADFFVDDVFAD